VTPQVSVVIACHSQERMQLLLLAIESVRVQALKPASIVIAVDHEPLLFGILSERFPDLTVVENKFERGASGTRNTGVAFTHTSLVAFLDDDARARPDWLSALVEPFDDPLVICTGGFVAAAWELRKPRWFPEEFSWVVGASHRGLPTSQVPVRNVWSENMAIRQDVFSSVGGFRPDFGKVGVISRPEDTDLCLRMGKAVPGGLLMFVPGAVVDHHVGEERSRFRFFLKRCYSEGRGKVELARNNNGRDDLSDERAYVRETIPQGFARYLHRGTVNGNFDEFRRAGALAVGLGAAAVGAAVSLVSFWSRVVAAKSSSRARVG
jgi:glucosyl-dolichyl phosphate glucuronosyltransferase